MPASRESTLISKVLDLPKIVLEAVNQKSLHAGSYCNIGFIQAKFSLAKTDQILLLLDIRLLSHIFFNQC